MKRILPLLLCTALFSCKENLTKQQQAEKTVKLYLDSTLNDPKTYQAVKFDKIDTIFSSFSDEPDYKRLEAKEDSFRNLQSNSRSLYSSSSMKELKQISAEHTKLLDSLKKAMDDQLAYMKSYKGKPIGWQIQHTFRASNGVGALTIGTTRFELDSTLTKVLEARQMKNK